MTTESYYQATKSGTKFESVEPDPESMGLTAYNEPQEEAARAFSKGSEDILVMGGISGSGKSYAMKRLARELGFDFVDFHAVGQYTRDTARLGAKEVAHQILNARRETTEAATLLIMDEGVSGIIADGQSTLRDGMDGVIRELLRTHQKIIILGGGVSYTSDEQSAMIAEALPRDLKISTHAYPFKNLNLRQTADLAQRARLGIHQDRDDVEKLLPRESAELIAQITIRYFRLLRETIRMAGILAEANFDPEDVRINIRNQTMPEDVFRRESDRQLKMIETKRTELKTLLTRK